MNVATHLRNHAYSQFGIFEGFYHITKDRNVRQNHEFVEAVLAKADAMTERDHQEHVVDGFRVESIRRAGDFMAWINGDRKCWGAGSTRGQAIDSEVRTANSFQYPQSGAI